MRAKILDNKARILDNKARILDKRHKTNQTTYFVYFLAI